MKTSGTLQLCLLLPIFLAFSGFPEPGVAAQFPPEMPWSVYATGISSVDMLAFDASGMLYANREIYSGGTDTVNTAGQSGQWVTGLQRADGIVYHAPTGNFYVSEEVTPGRVQRIDPSGAKTIVVPTSQINSPEGLSFHPATGDLYIAEDRYGGRIRIYNLGTGAITTFWSGLSRAEGIAFHSSGDLYIAETATDRVLRIDSTPSLSVFVPSSAGINNPDNIIWSNTLNVFFVDEDVASTGRIFWVTVEGDARVFATGINAPQGMAFDTQGNLYVSEQFSNRVLKVDGVYANQVFNISVDAVTESTALVSWNSFQRSDSQIEYGLDSTYGNATTLDPALTVDHTHFIPGLQPGTTYHYRVRSESAGGSVFHSGDGTFTTAGISTDIRGATGEETARMLFEIVVEPNPTRGETAFRLRLPAPGSVEIGIFGLSGRRVRTLRQQVVTAGESMIPFDGRSDNGTALPSGTYLYRALSAGEEIHGRIVLIQ